MTTAKEILEKYVELCTREDTCEYDDHEEFILWLEDKVSEEDATQLS